MTPRTGLNVPQLRAHVIRPTLQHLGLASQAAEELLLGTAAQESRLHYLKQLGRGPALGLYQCEPNTHDDLWRNFLRYRPELASKLRALLAPEWSAHQQLIWNLAYATAIARVHYFRIPRPLPGPGDLAGQARYWKVYYNTVLGKGTVDEYASAYVTLIAPHEEKAA